MVNTSGDSALSMLSCAVLSTCPTEGANYIGKTERMLFERTVQHAWIDNNIAVCKHLNDVSNICLILSLCIVHCLRHDQLFKTVTNLI